MPDTTYDKTKVNVGKPSITGAVYRAPLETALPTDATTALNSAFISVGYISEDGVNWSYSGDVTEFKAWGGDVVHREVNDTEDQAQFTMIESSNQNAVKAYYGDSAVTETSGGYAVSVGDPDTTRYSWVFEMVLQNNGIRRIVVPAAAVTERSDITYSDDDLVAYGITIQADKDSNGKFHYEYVQL